MQRFIFVVSLVFIFLNGMAQNGTEPIKVTDMLKIRTVGGVTLSKDGSTAVFSVNSIEPDGETKWEYKYVNQLWMVNTDGNSSPRQLTSKENASQATF